MLCLTEFTKIKKGGHSKCSVRKNPGKVDGGAMKTENNYWWKNKNEKYNTNEEMNYVNFFSL